MDNVGAISKKFVLKAANIARAVQGFQYNSQLYLKNVTCTRNLRNFTPPFQIASDANNSFCHACDNHLRNKCCYEQNHLFTSIRQPLSFRRSPVHQHVLLDEERRLDGVTGLGQHRAHSGLIRW